MCGTMRWRAESSPLLRTGHLLCILLFCVTLGPTSRWVVIAQTMDPVDAKTIADLFHLWNVSEPLSCDKKHYLTCSPEGKVLSLIIVNRSLIGTIPHAIANLTELWTLKLVSTELHGEIPDSIGKMENLAILELSGNRLTGGIPDSLGNGGLVALSLRNNWLTSCPEALLRRFGSAPFLGNCIVNVTTATTTPGKGAGAGAGHGQWLSIVNGQRSPEDCQSLLPTTPPPPPGDTTPPHDEPSEDDEKGNKGQRWLRPVVILSACIVATLGTALLLLLVLFVRHKRRQKSSSVWGDVDTGTAGAGAGAQPPVACVLYSLHQLRRMTDGWSERRLLGKGGFGSVYRGIADVGGSSRVVAVKRLHVRKGSAEESRTREFLNEVRILGELRHRNLVSLLGFCAAAGERVLVMEFAEKGSLSDHLFRHAQLGLPPLSWSHRKRVAIGTAEGLHYLHALNSSHKAILHRDVKADNILLDTDLNPRVCDFGIARLTRPQEQQRAERESVTVNRPGTVGYMAPEWLFQGKLSDKIDVYSFGMVLLELVTGSKCVAPLLVPSLSSHALLAGEAALLACTTAPHVLEDLIDDTIREQVPEEEARLMLHISLLCVVTEHLQRPPMGTVLSMLKRDKDPAPLPDPHSSWPWGEAYSPMSSTGYNSSSRTSDSFFREKVTMSHPGR